MDKIKINSLGNIDEIKFKKLALDRDNWISDGANMNYNYRFAVRESADKLYPLQTYLELNSIIKENDTYKTLIFKGLNGEPLPEFKSGQKIALTFSIGDKFYTRPFSLSNHPLDASLGVYKITIKDDEEDEAINYLYNKIKTKDKVASSHPFGDFYYDEIRDSKNIIAIASSTGIIPIYSMIQSVLAKEVDYNITLFYSEKEYKDLVFIDDLLDAEKTSPKIKVFICLSEEEKEGCIQGFVTKELIKREMKETSSIFISGGEGLLKYLNKELVPLKLPRKYIKYDMYLPKCNIKKVVEYKLSIYINDEKYDIPCYNNKTIMKSLEEAGIFIPSKCHNGSCSFCNSELVKGKVKVVNDKRNDVDKQFNLIHPCTTYPASDIEIIVR